MTREQVVRWGAWLLVAVSFAGSFTHVVDVLEHEGHQDTEQMAWAIAGIAELMVGLAILRLTSGDRGPATWVTGLSAFAFTVLANGSTAGRHDSGFVSWDMAGALWPAWGAACAFWLAGHGSAITVPAQVSAPIQPTAELPVMAGPVDDITAVMDGLTAPAVAEPVAEPRRPSAKRIARPNSQAVVARAMADGREMAMAEIVLATGLPRGTVKTAITKLVEAGAVESSRRGHYRAVMAEAVAR